MKRKKLRVALMSALISLGGVSLALGTLVSCGTTEKYAVTYEASDDYTISIASGTEYAVDETVSFTVTAASGKVLSDVTANGSSFGNGGTYSFIMPSSNVTLVITVIDEADQYNFVATYTGSWGLDEVLTISATVDGTSLADSALTVTATTGADLVSISGTTVTLTGLGDVVLIVSTVYNGVTLTDTILGTVTTIDYSISQITGAGTYTIRGTVVAESTSALVVYDGTAGIYAYGSTHTNVADVGDYVQISGSVSLYSNVLQYGYSGSTTTVLEEGGGTTYTPEELTVEKADALANSTNSTTEVKFYTWTATVGTNNGYTTLNLDGSNTIIEPMNVDSTLFPLIQGQRYKIEAWFYGYAGSSNKYAAVVLTSAQLLGNGITVTSPDNTTSLYTGSDNALQLTATYDDTDTHSSCGFTWSSSNTNVATVDQNGKVTGLRGSTTVVIYAYDSTHGDIYGLIVFTVYNTTAVTVENATLADVAETTIYDGTVLFQVSGAEVSSITSSYYGELELTHNGTTIELYNCNYSANAASLVLSEGAYSYVYGNGSRLDTIEGFDVGTTVNVYIIAQSSTTSSGYTYENFYGCVISYTLPAAD